MGQLLVAFKFLLSFKSIDYYSFSSIIYSKYHSFLDKKNKIIIGDWGGLSLSPNPVLNKGFRGLLGVAIMHIILLKTLSDHQGPPIKLYKWGIGGLVHRVQIPVDVSLLYPYN
jgi:hypothetical protein